MMGKNIRDEFQRWEKTTLSKVLSKAPEREPSFKTTSGIEMKRLFSPLDMEDTDYCEDLGFPGEFPYPGSPAYHVPRPALDHAPVCGICNARGDE
jgi:methylmalonyl-CoA mutase N-terminal domain/subunit